ncbi:major facilitator transporter [Arthrobacter sp. RIT-PI-e]|uniref:sugar porter family MFS transporter n=1 Tax=Arthrobacter sp. RIT-PI-e TaxID=1681197 RepID=UPI0006765A7D|nr:sugar porter family MFS transporter [Arthrobacter sp. RIT-PI-e]KNC18168.1 major facilitator transporter [Arthrobacter sp. RIT-PI-e]
MSGTDAVPGGTRPPRHLAKVIGITIAAAVGGLLFGFDTAVINGAVDSIQADFGLSAGVLGFTVAITLLGCAAGAWFAGGLADRWGRKKVMVLAAILFAVNSVGSGYAFSEWDLMLWRLVGGFAIGLASVIVPGYIAEIAPSKWRGALASVQQLAITVGIFAALLSDASFADAAGGAGNEFWWGLTAWRWMLLVGVAPAVIYGVLALIIPESPQFLIRAGRDEEAAGVLSRVSGVRDTSAKIGQIRASFEREDRASYRDLRGPAFGLQPILWVGMAIAALQQLVGINAIFYYSTTLWQSVGFSESDSFTTSVITSVINLVMTFVAIFFVDRIGRRKLLLAGSIGMTVGLAAATLAFAQADGTGADIALPGAWGPIALVGANLFVIFFAATWGPVMWVTLGEMFPNRIRSIALGVATMVNWIFNFVVTVSFPWVSENLGLWIMYAAFTVFAVLSFVFVRTKLPEFAGRDLEDNAQLSGADRS